MSGVPVSKLPDDDMQAAPAALVRAGQQARELARRTGTAVVVLRDGILVEERADDCSGSHDHEDVIAMVDGRQDIVEEVRHVASEH